MKKIILLFIWINTVVNSIAQTPFINPVCNAMVVSPTSHLPCNNNPWVLVFEDHFKNESIDSRKWGAYTGVPYDYTFSMQKQWYQEQNLSVVNGKLVIEIVKEFLQNKTCTAYDPLQGQYILTSNYDFSSGFLSSKYLFGYGQLEIRCNVPWLTGLWPASWLFGTNQSGSINNEIDNFEFIFDNGPVEHLMTQHYNNLHCPTGYHAANFVNSWHTFNISWSPYNIEWYVDGVLKRIDYRFSDLLSRPLDCSDVNNSQPFTTFLQNNIFPQNPMLIYTNVAVRYGSGNIPPDMNAWPVNNVKMEVEYIKYYQRLPCSSNLHITSFSNFNNGNYLNPVYKTYLGSQVQIYNNCTLSTSQNQKQLEIIGRDIIRIKENVSIKQGVKFTARIDPASCPGVPLEGPPTDPIDETPNETKEGLINNGDIINAEVNIYPNPISEGEKINIDAQNSVNELTFTVYSMLGQKKIETTINNVDNIETSSLKKGMYIYKIFNKSALDN
jgi:beta-glucanase (GH16 family)